MLRTPFPSKGTFNSFAEGKENVTQSHSEYQFIREHLLEGSDVNVTEVSI